MSSIQEARYSTKIPTQALRVIAGFDTDELHWNPRTQVEPPESLKKKIFPWIKDCLDLIYAANDKDDKDRSTAIATLRFWYDLRIIILQDAAAIAVEYPERRDHIFFTLPVFREPEFSVSGTDVFGEAI